MLGSKWLATLASFYYEQTVANAISKVYISITPEITDLASKGLVLVHRSTLDPSLTWVETTQEGMRYLRECGAIHVAQVLLDMKYYVPLEYYIGMLPAMALPQFLTCAVDFIREAAAERYKEIYDCMAGLEYNTST